QYFPSDAYLLRVLDQLLAHNLSKGGSIFIGDVRSLPLLTAFHASVYAFKSGGRLAPERLAALAENAAKQPSELALDPAFFHALKQRHPRISSVQVAPKRGACAREMRGCRYDVLIRTDCTSVSDQSFAFAAAPQSIEEIAEVLSVLPDTLAYKA